MSYLVCDNCGGYYELQEGESPEKFDLTCDCGGKIQYKNSIESDGKSEDLTKKSSIWIRLAAIAAGAIIIILAAGYFNEELPCMVLLHSHPYLSKLLLPTYLLTLVIAGFVTGFTGGGSYKNGIFNSAAAGLIGGIWAFLFSPYQAGDNIPAFFMTSFLFNLIIINAVVCLIGGVTAVFVRKRFKR